MSALKAIPILIGACRDSLVSALSVAAAHHAAPSANVVEGLAAACCGDCLCGRRMTSFFTSIGFCPNIRYWR